MTLKIQKEALKHEMILKDASAYNIQFLNGKPIHIDTLSFEKYEQGKPWVAYKQFCQHFLAPLLLMSYVDVQLNKLLILFIDGVPLDTAARILPKKCVANPFILTHIFLHAKSIKKFEGTTEANISTRTISKNAQLGLIDNLEKNINKLSLKKYSTEWESYYENTNYSKEADSSKVAIINEWVEKTKPANAWDLGANTGKYSRLLSNRNIFTVSLDIDPNAVNQNYKISNKNGGTHILPLLLDLTNPSPSIGWDNTERLSLTQRTKPELVLALALIHHLAIGNNLPFEKLAEFFGSITIKWLIIEYIPKEDSNAQKLLANRKDIFTDYTQKRFETEFLNYFKIIEQKPINQSKRVLYLMERKDA